MQNRGIKQETYAKKIRLRNTGIILGCLSVLVLSALISINTGYSNLSPADTLRTILGNGTAEERLILFSFRMPRIAISVMAGAGLAASGCLLQGVTRNPLADSGLLGIQAGAGLTVVLYVLFFGVQSVFSVLTLPVFALLGAGVAAILVYALAYKKGEGSSPFRLIVTGIAIQAGLSALTTFLVVKLDDTQYGFVTSWQAGSIWGANWTFVIALVPWLLVCFSLMLTRAKKLDIMALGDDTAIGLGIAIGRERKIILAIAAVLAGACVAVCGSIGFVGLMAPHIGRRLVGPKHDALIPVSALVGAILVSASDTVARVLIQPSSLPTGIVVSVIGAPYFIYLISQHEKGARQK